jgi:hypothetical protein
MGGDGRVDQVAAQSAPSRQRTIFIRLGEAAVADDIRNQDRCELAAFAHKRLQPRRLALGGRRPQPNGAEGLKAVKNIACLI